LGAERIEGLKLFGRQTATYNLAQALDSRPPAVRPLLRCRISQIAIRFG